MSPTRYRHLTDTSPTVSRLSVVCRPTSTGSLCFGKNLWIDCWLSVGRLSNLIETMFINNIKVLKLWVTVSKLKCTKTPVFFVPNINLPIQSTGNHMSALATRISLFLCHASHVNLAELAGILTHDHDVRVMGLFSILRQKLLCIPAFKEILHCRELCVIDPCLSHHDRGSKVPLVLITARILPGI